MRRRLLLLAGASIALGLVLLARGRRAPLDDGRRPAAGIVSVLRLSTPEPVQARVRGRVEDSEGRGLPGATVVLVESEADMPPRARAPFAVATTAADGGFAFEAVPLGSFAILAMAPGFLPGRVSTAVSGARDAPAVTLALRRGGFLISGRVLDGSGGAIEGALVSRVPRGFTGDEHELYTALSDARGDYRLSLPAGEHTLVFRRDGYAESSVEVRATCDQQIDVRLGPGIRLSGRVIAGGTGLPVAGATVAAREVRGFLDLARARSDDEGRFSLGGLASGTYEVIARQGTRVGSAERPVSLVPPGEREVVITIDEGAVITGRVTRASGAPEPNARLALGRWDHETTHGDPAGFADGEGRFTIRGAAPEHTSIIAFGQGHAWATRRIHVLPGDRLTGVDLVVPETRPLVVTVTSAGKLAAGVEVSAGSARGGLGWRAEGRTAADGVVRLEGVAVEKVMVWARDDHGEAHDSVEVTDQPETTLRLALDAVPRISVEGHVRWGDGRPAAVPVFLFCRGPNWDHTRADATGAYHFDGCEPGPLSVRAARGDAGLDGWQHIYLQAEQPPLAATERTRTVDLTVAAGGKRIEGRLLLPDGRPASDVLVTVRGAFENRSALSDPDGQFLFDDLTREEHEVSAKVPGHRDARADTAAADVIGLVLRLRQGLQLAGTVLGPDGRPRPYVRVLALSKNGGAEAYSGGRGTFLLQSLEPGPNELFVRGDDGFDIKVRSLELGPAAPQPITLVVDAHAGK